MKVITNIQLNKLLNIKIFYLEIKFKKKIILLHKMNTKKI